MLPHLSRSSSLAVGLLIGCFAITLSPTWMMLLGANRFSMNDLQNCALAFATALFLLAVSARLWISALLISPWCVLAPFESYYIWQFGRPSDAHVLGILSETNLSEAIDFAGGHLVLLFAASLAILALVCTSILLCFRHRITWSHRSRLWVVGTCVIALLIPPLTNLAVATPALDPATSHQQANQSDKAAGEDLANYALTPEWKPYADAYPIGVPLRIFEFATYRQRLSNIQKQVEIFSFGATQRESHTYATPAQRQIFVLLIGESSRPDRWQLNGYKRETNQRLSIQQNVISFPDMISHWAWTRMSVPILLTRKPASNSQPYFAEKSLITAFREAGFQTYWLSTQSPLGPHDSAIAMHAQEAHEYRFLNPTSYQQQGTYDDALLDPFQKIIARNEPKQLIVLHTLGSHYNYGHRYPPAFDIFKPSLQGHPHPVLQNKEQKTEMNNAYDNSVRYTDHVIADVINKLEKTGQVASLLYVSDHGENLFDNECGKSGHGHNTEHDFRIASIFWHSNSYEQRYPKKIQNVRKHARSPLSTSMTFHSMLDLADIRFSGENLSASIFSPHWQAGMRLTQSGIDFDLSEREPICKTLLGKHKMQSVKKEKTTID